MSLPPSPIGGQKFPSEKHMEWKVVNPLEFPGWDDLLATQPESSFFHTSNWARVLSESYLYRPQYFVSLNGTLEAIIPFMEIRSLLTGRRGVSLPFTDYSEPIIGSGPYGNDWVQTVIRHGKASGWKYIEIRNPVPFPNSIPEFSTYFGHILDISDTEESVMASLRGSTKRNIKKAVKEGVTVAGFTTEESIREFFRLNCLTRKEHGLPPQPFHFFNKIFEHVITRGLGFVTLASYKGMNIAGAVCFHYGGKAIYKYGASDREYQHLRANNLAMWEAIRLSIRQGCKRFCFGRTEPENHGLMQFKSGWGTKEQTIRYYRYNLETDTFVRGKPYGHAFYNKIFNAMPISFSRVAGEILYRHVG
jgi:hypothetical protein